MGGIDQQKKACIRLFCRINLGNDLLHKVSRFRINLLCWVC